MYTVIGVGGIGIEVAKNFSNFPQYNLIYVDDEKHNFTDQHTIAKQKRPELYEDAFKALKPALKKNGEPRNLLKATIEKQRAAVYEAIKKVKNKIKKINKPLYEHLDESLKTGKFCGYYPKDSISWE